MSALKLAVEIFSFFLFCADDTQLHISVYPVKINILFILHIKYCIKLPSFDVTDTQW